MTRGDIYSIAGSSQNGKSTLTMALLKDFDRVLAWDIDEEYCDLPGYVKVRGIDALYRAIMQHGMKPVRIAYVPNSLADFDEFCEVALNYGEDTGRLAVVAEETADVTTPQKAPAGFGKLIRRGMKRGITLFCVTQRPSESDKTSLGNARYIISFYMSRADDRAYMAKELGCEPEQIEALKPYNYLKKNVAERELVAGEVTK